MAKQYTQAQWARIQSGLPEEDRVPYSLSPEKFDTQADVQTRTNRFAQVIEPGVAPDEFPVSVTQPRVSAPVVPMDITSQRYTAGATAAGLTPTSATSTSSSDALYNLKNRVGYGIDEQGNPITVANNTRTQQLPAGFTAGPFPKEFEKFFGAPGDILGYRINTETDKDGVTFYTLSVAQKGAYGEGVTGFSTFGARLMKDASGNWVSYMGKGSTTDSTTTNNVTGTFTASDGKVFTDKNSYLLYEQNIRNQNLAAASAAAAATAERKSAYDLLYQQFAKYGLQALVTPLESLIKEGVPASEFAIRLRETDAYQKRFAANKSRINKGLAALSEAEYIGLEDQYQNIMRQYGMPETYYSRGEMGKQEGFEKLIAGDVSAAELESRVSSAYNRVINANPEVVQSLKSYYPNITNGDILSYVLDPEKALTDINKKITAAEIGGAALGAGLGIDVARAEQLGAFGVTKTQAQQGYQTIAEFLPSATKLGEIYGKQGLGPYNQAVAETEVFGVTGAAEAARKRKQLTQLETAQFSGQVGVGALGRERAGQF